ncbi:GIY-YIG nuclease family protein [Cytophagales bacterium LB-30]|uniref:GIY-YIG nuclease family protein n=1 Tax=Shiella aurantiaca TaxID=3058365 RepID=A0ABT8F8U8_9BACT|nr:GIY-YIG nuclease family protein [Shiella aurantiaca]MDN4166631.1 GIY-YIG nuclease family protein [Shiella aurantiaca]
MGHGGCIYIMTNVHHTTLYIGVTSDLLTRVKQHKEGTYKKSFTYRYNLNKLVYYEILPTIQEAIAREKQLKAGSRQRKIDLINNQNPEWKDLMYEVGKW